MILPLSSPYPLSPLLIFNYGVIPMLPLYENIRLQNHQQEIKEICWEVPNWEVDGPGVMKIKHTSTILLSHAFIWTSSFFSFRSHAWLGHQKNRPCRDKPP